MKMSMSSEDLIAALASDTRPVRRLPSPLSRTVRWLLLSSVWVAFIISTTGFRPDLASKLVDARWLLEQGAAIATALFAAAAAFCAVIPGRSRWEHTIPLIPLGLWLVVLGIGCYEVWARYGMDGLVLVPDWACFPYIVTIGIGPAIVAVVMLRRGAPVTPGLALALGALASAALADFGLRLFHAQDASLMVLFWQVGTVLLLTAVGGAIGKSLLKWRVPIVRGARPADPSR